MNAKRIVSYPLRVIEEPVSNLAYLGPMPRTTLATLVLRSLSTVSATTCMDGGMTGVI